MAMRRLIFKLRFGGWKPFFKHRGYVLGNDGSNCTYGPHRNELSVGAGRGSIERFNLSCE